jgi:hypothetical protein
MNAVRTITTGGGRSGKFGPFQSRGALPIASRVSLMISICYGQPGAEIFSGPVGWGFGGKIPGFSRFKRD